MANPCKFCNNLCDYIGEYNRFEEKKAYCCNCYLFSDHKQIFNPQFTTKEYCTRCKMFVPMLIDDTKKKNSKLSKFLSIIPVTTHTPYLTGLTGGNRMPVELFDELIIFSVLLSLIWHIVDWFLYKKD